MGKTEAELAARLHEVFSRFNTAGLRLRKDKCSFGVSSIEFLGFKLDSLGIRPSQSKVKAIQNAPAPQDKKQLQAFLGLLNFYHSFLPNKATIAEPLHRLLDKNSHWFWKKEQQQAFENLKQLIVSERVLVHYSSKLPLVVVCDASPYGIGAVLSHRMPEGCERPIAFYSRTLSKPERNYAQIDREAVALIAGVKKFHDYLYGRKFTLVTDHWPLLGIFNTTKPVPNVISSQMLRRRIFLNAYDFEIAYRSGNKLGNADFLSRLPLMDEQRMIKEDVLMIEMVNKPVVDAKHIAVQTAKNADLAKVLSWALRGWPPNMSRSDRLYPFYVRRQEISSLKGCLLWGNRTIIPTESRQVVLSALHTGHPGIVRMKALARSYGWVPKMESEIEDIVKMCAPCQATRHENAHAPVHWWETTKNPWSRLHVDFDGPFQGKIFFIVVDSFSKWLEVFLVKSTSSQSAIKPLRSLFATHGLPDEIVSDNGTAFTSDEFKTFMQDNLIRHIRCAPFHPSSNGQAERMVQTTKDFLKKTPEWQDIDLRLSRFLFNQHITPHTSTGRSPAELMFKRQLKTFFDKIHPHELPTAKHEIGREKSFNDGYPVWVRNYSTGPKWVPAKINSRNGPISYAVQLDDDSRIIKRHLDQIRIRQVAERGNDLALFNQNSKEPETSSESGSAAMDESSPSSPLQQQSNSEGSSQHRSYPSTAADSSTPLDAGISSDDCTPRRSNRARRPPDFYSVPGR
ncbi:uncharacterized protein K02A2.6-like [Rhagoletis pomonella]|uniref:uncharacterized protein K02A2.6-like n=1 Tax=Rhagoletis pomonella TaxID=28610 RepID=UPI0017824ACC|nr:uncharacterized protein K02A2.6-like [Rhagoletis pomonella]